MIDKTLRYFILHHTQMIKFAIVGVTLFFINLFFFHLFFGVLKTDYQVATSFSYLITVLSHLTLHRFFTFNTKNQFLTGNAVKYLGMLIMNYVVTLIVMWMVVNIANCSPYFGVIASTIMTSCTSFFMMKYFIFK